LSHPRAIVHVISFKACFNVDKKFLKPLKQHNHMNKCTIINVCNSLEHERKKRNTKSAKNLVAERSDDLPVAGADR